MIVNTGTSLKDQFRRVMAFNGPRLLGLSFSRLGNLSLVLEPTTLNSRKALPGVFTPYGHHGCFEIEHPTAASVTVKTHTTGVIATASLHASGDVMATASRVRKAGGVDLHGLRRLSQ